jgi:hypothetical protein
VHTGWQSKAEGIRNLAEKNLFDEARSRGTVADCYLPGADHQRAYLDGNGPVAKGVARDRVRKELRMLPLVLSSDSHVFEPPDLWQTRIDAAFGDRAQRIQGSTPARAVHRDRALQPAARQTR